MTRRRLNSRSRRASLADASETIRFENWPQQLSASTVHMLHIAQLAFDTGEITMRATGRRLHDDEE
ncbi:hypothetical protein HSR121_1571 [Halapricum desulfuricans]|uniref:Uncharacterized protein n=1 Tax=Halapricum desulfuricans TaxID=2841257 RepID=A0A897MUU5_9EURY|nr:hypothetical protein HSR121_1571 [Halapricum desulfuricans]